VKDEPEVLVYRALLAEIQMELGHYDDAKASFDSLYHARRDLAVAPRLARWLEIRGEPARARRILEDALAQATRRADLPAEQVAWFYLRVADQAMRFGRLRDAERALDAGLRVQPDDGRLLAAHARIAALRGKWHESLRYIERAAARADIATLALAGDAESALGNASRAEHYYSQAEAAYAANPEPFARQWTQFRIEHRREIAETLELLKQETLVRRDVLGWDLLAWAHYQAGQYAEADRAITEAMRMGTQDALLFFHAGMIQRALSRNDSSRTLLKRALSIHRVFHPFYADSARRTLEALE
jgi:tetratricopeptide (TPR) repeat protein